MAIRLKAAVPLLTLLLACPLVGQQLFADGAGWYREPGYRSTAAQRRLYWTPDWGAHWNDITPKIPDGYQLGDIVFLDRSRGWVFLVPLCGARNGMANADLHAKLKLAFTADSGKSWTTTDVRLPDYSRPLSVGDGPGCATFADAKHGWMRIGLADPQGAYEPLLLASKDGGRSWELLSGSPKLGCVHFSNTKDGWLIDASSQLRIWRTQDGGNSWLEASPSVPADLGIAFGDYPTTSQSRKRASVPVLFVGPSGDVVVLFVTENQGRTWKRDITLPSRHRNGPPLGVVGSSIITGDLSEVTKETPKQILTLTRVTAEGVSNKQQAEAPSLPPLPGWDLPACPTTLSGLNMVDENHGWAYIRCGITDMLFATTDGGKSWSDVSPAAVPEMTDYRLGDVDKSPCQK